MLAGLGFDDARMAADVATLSGGWMMRVALARLLLARSAPLEPRVTVPPAARLRILVHAFIRSASK